MEINSDKSDRFVKYMHFTRRLQSFNKLCKWYGVFIHGKDYLPEGGNSALRLIMAISIQATDRY